MQEKQVFASKGHLQPTILLVVTSIFLTLPLLFRQPPAPRLPTKTEIASPPSPPTANDQVIARRPTPWRVSQNDLLAKLDFGHRENDPTSPTEEREVIETFAWDWLLYLAQALDPHSLQDCNKVATPWCRLAADGATEKGPTRKVDYFPRWMSWKVLDDDRNNACEGFEENPADADRKGYQPSCKIDFPKPPPILCAKKQDSQGLLPQCLCEGECLDPKVALPDGLRAQALLLDLKGAPVQYEIRVNPAWRFPQPEGNKVSFRIGSGRTDDHVTPAVAVKLAWKVLHKKDDDYPGDDPERFFVQKRVELNPLGLPAGAPTTVDLGLVAVHFTLKFDTFQTWIWTSFEHVDLVADKGVEQPLFFDESKERWANTYDKNVPAQLVRTTKIPPITEARNQVMKEMFQNIDSVWKNYRLIGAQYRPWVRQGDDPPGIETCKKDGERHWPSPCHLRNIAIEPFGVTKDDTLPQELQAFQEEASCLRCHQSSDKSIPNHDFSFQTNNLCRCTLDDGLL